MVDRWGGRGVGLGQREIIHLPQRRRTMLKIVEEVTTVYRVLDAADRLIRELPTLIEAEAFKLGFEEATPALDPDCEMPDDEPVEDLADDLSDDLVWAT